MTPARLARRTLEDARAEQETPARFLGCYDAAVIAAAQLAREHLNRQPAKRRRRKSGKPMNVWVILGKVDQEHLAGPAGVLHELSPTAAAVRAGIYRVADQRHATRADAAAAQVIEYLEKRAAGSRG